MVEARIRRLPGYAPMPDEYDDGASESGAFLWRLGDAFELWDDQGDALEEEEEEVRQGCRPEAQPASSSEVGPLCRKAPSSVLTWTVLCSCQRSASVGCKCQSCLGARSPLYPGLALGILRDDMTCSEALPPERVACRCRNASWHSCCRRGAPGAAARRPLQRACRSRGRSRSRPPRRLATTRTTRASLAPPRSKSLRTRQRPCLRRGRECQRSLRACPPRETPRMWTPQGRDCWTATTQTRAARTLTAATGGVPSGAASAAAPVRSSTTIASRMLLHCARTSSLYSS